VGYLFESLDLEDIENAAQIAQNRDATLTELAYIAGLVDEPGDFVPDGFWDDLEAQGADEALGAFCEQAGVTLTDEQHAAVLEHTEGMMRYALLCFAALIDASAQHAARRTRGPAA